MNLKIVTIIGARPQIIKAAALSRAISSQFSDQIQEIIVHTGQHYDENMSEVFFSELNIPRPHYNLNVGSASHGLQTARMIEGIEKILISEKPDYLVVYGDTNSTLAGAVAAAKLHVRIVHIEAGLRSFNKSMPEEINRILCDHCSSLLFSPTTTGYNNLLNEGFPTELKRPANADHPAIFHCGDIMYDNSLHFAGIAESKQHYLSEHGIDNQDFILCTIHRNNNTDESARLNAIFSALHKITLELKTCLLLPLHPRTSKLLEHNLSPELYQKVTGNPYIRIVPPASFLEMILLEKRTSMVITDSGGVQKEAYFFNKPCIILRAETEWTEIIDAGAALLTDADEQRIIKAARYFRESPPQQYPDIFGDGKAADFICQQMLAFA